MGVGPRSDGEDPCVGAGVETVASSWEGTSNGVGGAMEGAEGSFLFTATGSTAVTSTTGR